MTNQTNDMLLRNTIFVVVVAKDTIQCKLTRSILIVDMHLPDESRIRLSLHLSLPND